MSNLIEWQREDNTLFSPVPAGNWNKELPSQMLAAVGKMGFYRYFEYTNDSTFIKYVYPGVKKYMDVWKMGEDNLVVHRKGEWDWFDWGSKIDVPILDNSWYYMALDGAKRMAEVSGYPDEAKKYQHKMDLLKTAFNKKFWRNNFYSSADYRFTADDRGNGLAVVAGLVNKDQWKKMRPVLDTTFHAGPYMEKYILEAYFVMGDADAGMARMKNRYAEMIKSDVTTLWEGWVIGGPGFGGGSYNHGWSGGPLTLMSQYIAGLAPGKPGYKSINIFPQPGNLTSIHAGAETASGFVKVDIENSENEFVLKINALKGKEMLVGIPVRQKKCNSVKVNGQLILKGNMLLHHKGIKYKGIINDYLVFEVPSGEMKFEITY